MHTGERGHAGSGDAIPVSDPRRGTVQILVARVVFLVTGFAVSVILARGLGPAEFGIYGVVLSLLVWFERAISAGLPGATAALILRGDSDRLVVQTTTLILMCCVALPMFFGALICAPLIAQYFGIPAGAALIRIAALNLPLMALYFICDAVFNGLRMFSAQSTLQMSQSLTKLFGVLLLLLFGLSLTGVMIAHVAATLVTVGLAAVRLPMAWGRPSTALMKEMVRIALPMGGYLLALMALTSLSLWQLQTAAGMDPQQVGFYVAAVNLTRILMMVPSTVSGVLFASLLWARSTSQPGLATKYLQGAVRFAAIATVPACLLLALDAAAVMELLFGPEYAAGGRILALLCAAFALVAFADVLFHALMAYGRFGLTAGVVAALVPVLYLLNSAWIPEHGGAGAAAAFVVTIAIGVAVAAGLVRLHVGMPVRTGTIARVCASGAVVGLLSAFWPTTGVWLVIKLGALSLLYVTLLWVSRELSWHDLRPFALWRQDSK